MPQNDRDKRVEAIEWVIRLRDPVRADWEGFMAWLEADPSHNEAYEYVALADREVEEAFAYAGCAPLPSNDNLPADIVVRRRTGRVAAARSTPTRRSRPKTSTLRSRRSRPTGATRGRSRPTP